MENISIGLNQDLLVDILISNLKVISIRIWYGTYTDKHHHVLSSDILVKKVGIGLNKASKNLEYKTQEIVRSIIKPLTWQYRTGFLSRMFSRLNLRFYTDTLFSKDKSIVGNTCTQIFTDENFISITSMIS